MAILDVFKKKKEIEKKITEKKSAFVKTSAGKEKGENYAWRILKSLQITEKATDLAEKNQYVFRVFARANKPEIKKAVENVYGVNVSGVRIINIPKKQRRLGRTSGWRKGYKKAIVRIQKGQKIEVLPR